MSDPNKSHLECPACRTIQTTLYGVMPTHTTIDADGKVTICPGPSTILTRYAATSHFASCPAATGVPVTGRLTVPGCPQFPDHAHRCKLDRATHTVHACTCRFSWISSSAPTEAAT